MGGYGAFHKAKHKYNNHRIPGRWITGEDITFDSKKESVHADLLVARLKIGEITNLRRQVRFDMIVNGIKVCYYEADFVYDENGQTVVVDVKSEVTRKIPVYVLKKKLMFACHGITIKEV